MNDKNPKPHLLFIQLPNPQFSAKKHWGNVPLAAGYLKSMAYKTGLLNKVDIEILDAKSTNLASDSRLIQIIEEKKLDIIGFSLYVWNSARSLYIAKEIKSKLSNVTIIVGGPEVTRDNDFILKNDAIDIGCIGEGENTFVGILMHLIERKNDLSEIPGLFFRKNKSIIFTSEPEPIHDLDTIPSPYLLGFINPKDYGFGWIETTRGCPFKCKYCAWKVRPKGSFSSERIIKELKVFRAQGIKFVKFLNSDTLTALHIDDLHKKIKLINKDNKLNLFGFMSAEQIDAKKAEMLKDIGFVCIGIGLQSTNPQTLKNLSRKQNLKKFINGCRLLMEKGIRLEMEFIIGLPYDHLQDFKNTFEFFKAHDLITRNKLTPFILLMLPGTVLREESNKYGIIYNPKPPYQILKTDYLSEEEIQTASNLSANEPLQSLLSIMPHVYGTKVRTKNKQINQIPDLIPTMHQINHVLIDIDASCQHQYELANTGKYFSANLNQPITFWFNIKKTAQSGTLIASFLEPIADKNPFLTSTIILAAESVFKPELIQKITDLPFTEKIVQGSLIGSGIRIGAIFPWKDSIMEYGEEIRDLAKSIHLYWSVNLSVETSWEKILAEIKKEPLNSGAILELDPYKNFDATINLLLFLIKNDMRQAVFNNFEINALLKYLSRIDKTDEFYAPEPEFLKHVVWIDKYLNVKSYSRPSFETNLDILALQVKCLRKLNRSTRINLGRRENGPGKRI
jgi:radical SAM superfamily enzyme YgiQ (UPF0313 family)